MTEAEWLACNTPMPLVQSGRLHVVSGRKLRLLGCAYCRRNWHLLDDARSRAAIEVAERRADNGTTSEELWQARHNADLAKRRHARRARGAAQRDARHQAAAACWEVATSEPFGALSGALYYASRIGQWDPDKQWDSYEEGAEQCKLLRDIFGNPFRPVAFSPSWRTSTVVALAAQMYESRDFSAMPILGDALQDAGCEDEQVLAHCRGPGPHVRGCHIVDLVLAKE